MPDTDTELHPLVRAALLTIQGRAALHGGATMTYRAAYVNDAVLTGPEHADLPDSDLIEEAVAEAKRAFVWGGKNGIAEADIEIGDWTDHQDDLDAGRTTADIEAERRLGLGIAT